MTKKDYVLIAGVFSWFAQLPDAQTIAEAMANRLQQENYKFDRSKFLKACRVV